VWRGKLYGNSGVDGSFGRVPGSDVGLECFDEQGNVGVPAGVGELDAVVVGEALEALGKKVDRGHLRVVDEDGDDRDLAFERRGHFEGDEVVGIFEAALAVGVLDADPGGTHDGEEDAAAGDVVFDGLAKVDPGLDAGDIHEHGVVAEVANEIIEQTTSFPF
jgi:hypothetical protein